MNEIVFDGERYLTDPVESLFSDLIAVCGEDVDYQIIRDVLSKHIIMLTATSVLSREFLHERTNLGTLKNYVNLELTTKIAQKIKEVSELIEHDNVEHKTIKVDQQVYVVIP